MKDVVMIGHLAQEHSLQYCKIDEENKGKPSCFEMEIELNGKYYAYGFECILNESKIISEWLVQLNASKDTIIFERDVNLSTFKSKFDNNFIKAFKQGIDGNDNVLFLNEMNRNKDGFYKENKETRIFKDIFKWFKNNLDINMRDRSLLGYSYLIEDESFEEITKLLKLFGTGISTFKLEEISEAQINKQLPDEIHKLIEKRIYEIKNTSQKQEQKEVINFYLNKCFYSVEFNILDDDVLCKKLKFIHANSSSLFEVFEESDGTIVLLGLLEILLTKERDKVFVIDDIDKCLHPNLTYKFIQTFLKYLEDRNIQLITTSNELKIMDLKLLRRDEIGFVKKDENGESIIFSLDEFNPHFDQILSKAYLDGRYGAVPEFGSFDLDFDED